MQFFFLAVSTEIHATGIYVGSVLGNFLYISNG